MAGIVGTYHHALEGARSQSEAPGQISECPDGPGLQRGDGPELRREQVPQTAQAAGPPCAGGGKDIIITHQWPEAQNHHDGR